MCNIGTRGTLVALATGSTENFFLWAC